RLARLDAMSFELTERGERLHPELARVFGKRMLAAIIDGAPIGELERAFGDRAQARAAVDAMLLCDAITASVADVGLGATIPGLALTAEHKRIRTADDYAVLMAGRRARPPEIAAAYAARRGGLDRDSPVIRDPRDRAKLDELRRVYEVAHATLGAERARAAYD